MKLQNTPQLHLTYCLNIHGGDTWPEVLAAIQEKALTVRDRVTSSQTPFGLGLRLSCEAAKSLVQTNTLEKFKQFLKAQNLYIFTINGFPYGRFHGGPIKQNVYHPDWQCPARRDYTLLLAHILAELLPDDREGSISTVPCSYKSWVTSKKNVQLMIRMLMDCVARLAAIREERGKHIHIGLEPEPDCFIENTKETIAFFKGPLTTYGSKYLATQVGCRLHEATEMIQRHLGVCLDACHAAVQFEDPCQSLKTLHNQNIRISKVQISAALACRPTPKALKQLQTLDDPVYLHQVKERKQNRPLTSYPDLDEALKSNIDKDAQWRIHYHVPVYWTSWKNLYSTAVTLNPEFWKILRSGSTSQIEIETYTFDLLPEIIKGRDITASIAKEYAWTLRRLCSDYLT